MSPKSSRGLFSNLIGSTRRITCALMRQKLVEWTEELYLISECCQLRDGISTRHSWLKARLVIKQCSIMQSQNTIVLVGAAIEPYSWLYPSWLWSLGAYC